VVRVRALDLRLEGHEFDSCTLHYRVMTEASCTHPCAFATKQYNYWPEGSDVTMGLMSHWPCATNLVVYPPMGSRPQYGR